MKKLSLFIAVCSLIASVLLTSCDTALTLKAVKTGGAELTITSDLTKETVNNIRSLTGSPADIPFFSEDELIKLLKDIGGFNIKAKVKSESAFDANCFLPDFTSGVFKSLNMVTLTGNTMTLTLGPEQLKNFYNQLTPEAQSYFDMFMAPAITGEKLNLAEYRELLSSLYGPKIAAEFTDGPVALTLTSPDGEKATKVKLTLGELMTIANEKSWSVTW